MRRYIYIVSSVLFVLFFASCQETSKSAEKDLKESSTAAETEKLSDELIKIGLPNKLDYLIDNLILSDNMIMTLSSEKRIFDKSLLNDYSNSKLYTTSRAKAVNLGIFGAELNYLIHFEQSQFSMKYLIASKHLSDQIGVAMAFDQKTMEEYQSNVENKDSLINIIFLAYDNVKKMLKNEDQFLLSTLVITGSWIENMYITTELLPYFKSREIKAKLVTKIVEQQDYLAKTVDLLGALNDGENIYVNELLKDLKTIDSIYVSFGDRLLVENDVKLLNQHVKEVRAKIIKVN